MAKQPRPKPRVTSAGEIGQLQHNEAAYAHREMQVGGVYDIIGAAATETRVGYYASLRVINTAGTWAYIAIGPTGLAAPTGLADGHGIPPNSEMFISTGEQGEFVRTSAATVGVYKAVESIVVADTPAS
jgi:hypothetical protein